MLTIVFLIFLPLLAAALLSFGKSDTYRKFIVYFATSVIILTSIFFAVSYFKGLGNVFFLKNSEAVNMVMLFIEVLISVYIIYLGIKIKRYLALTFSVIQTGLIIWLELFHAEELPKSYHLFVDKFSIIMMLIIGIVGSLICIFAVGYMKDYHSHHKEYEDRRNFFFPVLFVFLSAMFGLVFSNNLIWLYFFWEITTLCSFLLIGYTKTAEAVSNSYTALWINLLGGLAFCVGIVFCALKLGVLDLTGLLSMGKNTDFIIVPVMLISFACLTKSAQMPFSKWLLGAMVAPTPTSALLHSATMVKAGVYLLIRISPLMNGNIAGLMVSSVGGLTFLAASLIAISQSDAKKVLAYSTIANLGLIVACAGIGSPEATWAGLLLIIFHAVSKSLMFLSVGSVESCTGSRDIEDMHGLIVKLPELAFVMVVGIAGMFLAPFGMLISKWAALKAFVDSQNVILVMMLVFGSAATLFYWTKWLGKLVAVLHHSERLPNTVKGDEWFSLLSHAIIMVGLCLSFPLISRLFIEPYLLEIFKIKEPLIISNSNMNIMTIMLIIIAILPFALRVLAFGKKTKMVTTYMAGVNTGDDRHFVDSFGEKHQMYLSNWYMDKYFGEKKLLNSSLIISAGIIVIFSVLAIGGLL